MKNSKLFKFRFERECIKGGIMVEDISRNTIYVLVVLTLLISVLGTWTVLSHVQGGPAPIISDSGTGSDSGKVSFAIAKMPEPKQDLTTGEVVFQIR